MKPLLVRVWLPLTNIAIVGFYLLTLDLPSRVLFVASGAVILVSALSLFAAPRSGLARLQLSVFTLIVLGLLLQGVVAVSPGLIPAPTRTFLETADVRAMRQRAVEHLEGSPFVKFAPHTRVRSPLYRGTDAQFAYEWTTDARGFKNTPAVARMTQVELVAVGDSFTEGMGVGTEDTWASRLTAAGHPTYNLGVQGYAPTQMEGSFRRYGAQLQPRRVIIAYCATTYYREQFFMPAETDRRALTGGINMLGDRREMRQQARYVVSALYLFGRTVLTDLWMRSRIYAHAPFRRPFFERYAVEITAVEETDSALARGVTDPSLAWTSTLTRFDAIIDAAEAIGSDVILLYLPSRATAYYEAATGLALPATYVESLEPQHLVAYARDRGIVFLNTLPRIQAYVRRLSETAPVSAYPYLELDSHMSATGHQLVADEVREYLHER